MPTDAANIGACRHRMCPLCLDAEVRRLTALLDAERARCAGLERHIRHLEVKLRAIPAPVPLPEP